LGPQSQQVLGVAADHIAKAGRVSLPPPLEQVSFSRAFSEI
jgi:hypothetical protein